MPNERIDGFISLDGGANDGIDPIKLPDNQFARGLNISCRRGLVRTRPPFKKLADLAEGTFQRAFNYSLNSADRIVYVIDGVIRNYNTSTGVTTTYTSSMSVSAPRCWFVKADKFCVIQDDESTPVILDGDDLITANVDDDPDNPTYPSQFRIGSIMAYGHGRIFLVAKFVYDNAGVITNEDGHPYWIASDVLLPDDKRNVLKWSETNYLNEGGAIGLPNELGFIKAMAFYRNASTSTGIGTLIDFTKIGCGSFAVNVARPNWKNTDLGQVLFLDSGTSSQEAVVNVNSDLIYRSLLGLDTMRYKSSEAQNTSGVLSSVPISSEVGYLFAMDTESDMEYTSGAYVNNRLYFTTGGRYDDGSFKCLVVMDTDIAHQITKPAATPIYNGAWTGLHFQQIFKAKLNGRDTLFAVIKNADMNELWYVNEDGSADNDTKAIKSRVYTKVFVHNKTDQGSATENKEFSKASLWLSDIVGDVSIKVYYRADDYPLWNSTRTHIIKASSGGLPQKRVRITLSPDGLLTSDESTKRLTRVGYTFQYCIEIEGCCKVKTCKFECIVKNDPSPSIESETEIVELEATDEQVELDDFDYSIL